MFNRRYESDRPEIFYHFSPYHHPFFPELGPLPPVIDEHARLLAEEAALATQIRDDERAIDKDTIYHVVNICRKIAHAGYPLKMVPLDEMLDIVNLYYLNEPTIQPRTVADWASRNLNHLQGKLQDTGNLAWTARVAATLAYYSTLENQNTSRSNPEVIN